MWIVRLALRRPFTIAVLCALIGVFGFLSVSRMKTDILPAIDIPVVIVVWAYPGLSAAAPSVVPGDHRVHCVAPPHSRQPRLLLGRD